MMLQLGKGALQRVAAEHNVRSILFHLTPATAQRAFIQEPGVQSAIQALKQHGYLLGFIGDAAPSSILSHFNAVHDEKENGVSLYESMSRKLNVPLSRTLLVTEPSLVESRTEEHDKRHKVLPVVLPPQADGKSLPLLSLFAEGHVLVVPKRPVARFEMLDMDEVSDLWVTAQRVGKKVERHYAASSLTFAIQDGKDAGQTVKHVHIHVIPRVVQDFERNDDIYTEIEKHEQTLFVDNEMRTARSEADMAAEATQLRDLFL
ncbi:hypothetical protein PHYBOEH_001376 [Phytophthora boehmeriae]|uniref:Bis(5'-adenosyl)-triphosphatase n=1 Tax=Phytophthora boehmeriae TaxID=109152 RepID=A0A8T1X7R2_9STRA|nr:hypothetical protein PHYBOEH_001376 [Phytophthora boehmeriae]